MTKLPHCGLVRALYSKNMDATGHQTKTKQQWHIAADLFE